MKLNLLDIITRKTHNFNIIKFAFDVFDVILKCHLILQIVIVYFYVLGNVVKTNRKMRNITSAILFGEVMSERKCV